MFNFEKLAAWHKAIALADVMYRHRRNFPAEERFGLTNQMPRSIVSVSSNIAEAEVQKRTSDGLLRLGLVPCSPIQSSERTVNSFLTWKWTEKN
jgi:hypothetical protein